MLGQLRCGVQARNLVGLSLSRQLEALDTLWTCSRQAHTLPVPPLTPMPPVVLKAELGS